MKQCYFSKLQMSGDKHTHLGYCLQLVPVKGICPCARLAQLATG